MSRLNTKLFHYLLQHGIFKGNYQTGNATEATIQRRQERNRGRLAWLSIDLRLNLTGSRRNAARGTYIRNKHGMLK